jgi:putative FmdB family regulatory protein
MPTYQYACTDPGCGATFERVQSFTDPAVSECPECAQPVRKVYSSVGVVFKGSGFYRTDSRNEARANAKNGARNGAKPAAGNDGSAASPAAGKDASGNGTSRDAAAKNGSAKPDPASSGSKGSGAATPNQATTPA